MRMPQAFDRVMAAYRLPKTSDDEKAARTRAIQSALQGATIVPLDTLRACADALAHARVVAEHGNASAASDAGVAIGLLRAAAAGADANVQNQSRGNQGRGVQDHYRRGSVAVVGRGGGGRRHRDALGSLARRSADAAEHPRRGPRREFPRIGEHAGNQRHILGVFHFDDAILADHADRNVVGLQRQRVLVGKLQHDIHDLGVGGAGLEQQPLLRRILELEVVEVIPPRLEAGGQNHERSADLNEGLHTSLIGSMNLVE